MVDEPLGSKQRGGVTLSHEWGWSPGEEGPNNKEIGNEEDEEIWVKIKEIKSKIQA